jgi:hypothetical protein
MFIKKTKFRLENLQRYLWQLEKAIDANDQPSVKSMMESLEEELGISLIKNHNK